MANVCALVRCLSGSVARNSRVECRRSAPEQCVTDQKVARQEDGRRAPSPNGRGGQGVSTVPRGATSVGSVRLRPQPLEDVGGVDQRGVGEALREVANLLARGGVDLLREQPQMVDRKSTRLNSSHTVL